jgi:hypothetical protein
MPDKIEGTYTLRRVLLNTYEKFGTRFDYMQRDVLKRIYITRVTELFADRPGAPTVKYEISTRSYPQYKPYISKVGKKQRTVHHDYDTILEMDEMDLDTVHWKARVGTGKKIKKAPEKLVKSIRHTTMMKWKKERDARVKRAKTDKAKEKAKDWLKMKILEHRQSAPYLTEGDYVAQELGINLDFAYRDAAAFKFHGHLFGRWEYPLDRPSKLNPTNIMFLPKHLIRIVKTLMERGILKG